MHVFTDKKSIYSIKLFTFYFVLNVNKIYFIFKIILILLILVLI